MIGDVQQALPGRGKTLYAKGSCDSHRDKADPDQDRRYAANFHDACALHDRDLLFY